MLHCSINIINIITLSVNFSKRTKKMKQIINFFKKMHENFFVDADQKYLENYLSKSTDIYELEHKMKKWEFQKNGKYFLS